MRRFILAITVMLVALGAAPVLAADPLSELKGAEFLAIEDVSAVLPHGKLYLAAGVVGIFPGLDERLSGVFVGEGRIDWTSLPVGEGALNLFNELGRYDQGGVTIHVTRAYLAASPYGGAQIIPSGKTLALLDWSDLSRDQQEEFTAVYLMARSDGWLPAPSGPPMGMGGGAPSEFKLRDPVDKEVFLAAWDESGTRWDYRVNADASEMSLDDYTRSTTFVYAPWETSEWVLDDTVEFSSINYYYEAFDPFKYKLDYGKEPEKDYRASCSIGASFVVKEDCEEITLYSNPQLEIHSLDVTTHTEYEGGFPVLEDGYELPGFSGVIEGMELPVHFERIAGPYGDWEVKVHGSFKAGNGYGLHISSVAESRESYAGIGYGGALRYDTTALWPGEENSVDLEIIYREPHGIGSKKIASPNADVNELILENKSFRLDATWEDTSRNQMIVVTEYPSQIIPTTWGEMEVFAPEDMQGDIEDLEAVQAIGPIVQYFSDLWGERNVTRLPVFIIPEETGVQGFEDAGMVFILGGSGGGGGAGGSMGGMTALMAHELVHLWWGYDVSGPRWFGEAMANYGASKYLQHEAEQGEGSNVDDPYFYRRYIMNFALANELPLSMDRRDELDDSAAIYHNGPAALLTLDELRSDGLDWLLNDLHTAATGEPELSYDDLRGAFIKLGGDGMEEMWDRYIEDGFIPSADAEDDTYRMLVHTPERDGYQNLLGWLMPAFRKQYSGDTAGALYCAKRALDFRSEPKDFIYIADLTYKIGDQIEALERCMALLENPECDALNAIKAHWIMAQIYRDSGDTDSEMLELEFIAENGPAAGAMFETGQARERLSELTGEEQAAPDAETGATPGS